MLMVTLSLVMADCEGMDSAVSFRLCTYATLSTSGIRGCSPASSTELNFPKCSITYAFCCGTITKPR